MIDPETEARGRNLLKLNADIIGREDIVGLVVTTAIVDGT